MINKTLVIGDAHASPFHDNERFDWLGRLIIDERPDVVYCTGDFADMPSLSSYDKGKKSGELRRYAADIESAQDALARINRPIDDFNEQQKRNKKSAYRPRRIMAGGNHDEGRIEKAVQFSPELDGTISVLDIRYQDYGWEYIPYRDIVELEGVYCSHSFPSGVMGQPISGFGIAGSLLAKNNVSSLVGHCHLFDFAVRSKPDGTKLMALSPGWYGEHIEEYARHTQHMWWNGLCILKNVHDGQFDLETISFKEVRNRYAG